MKLRYGSADENVRKRSIEDVILHERQRYESIAEEERPGFAGAAGSVNRDGEKELISSGAGEAAGRWKNDYSLLCPSRAGALAVISSVNKLAAEGIRAEVFSPVILLPPDSEEETLRDLIRQIGDAAFMHGIRISEAQAEVTDAVSRPVVFGSAAGRRFFDVVGHSGPYINEIQGGGSQGSRSCVNEIQGSGSQGTLDIVLAGSVGLEGTYILVTEKKETLAKRFPTSLFARMKDLERDLCVLSAAEAVTEWTAGDGSGWSPQKEPERTVPGGFLMVSLGDGGLFTGLWELAAKTGCGMEVDLQAVPVLQETIEITNYLDINPYNMRSQGSLLIVSGDGEKLAGHLQEKGIEAVKIGELIPGKDKIIRNGEEIRYLDRPQTDTLALFLRERQQEG